MPITLDGNSFMDVEIDGQNMKYVQLDGQTVFTRVDLPVFTKQPNGGTVKDNQSFTSTVTVNSGDGTLTYQWFLNNAAQGNSNSASYTFAARPAGSYTIRCEVTNQRGKVVSNNATITVQASSQIAIGAKTDPFFGGTMYGHKRGHMGSMTPNTFGGKTFEGLWYAEGLGYTYLQFTDKGTVNNWGAVRVTVAGASARLVWDSGFTAYSVQGNTALAQALKNNNGRTVSYTIAQG